MPSSSLVLYDENAGTSTYTLASSSENKCTWVCANRSLAKPQKIEVERKLAPNNSGANDHMVITVTQTEASTLSPYKLCTFSAKLDFSIPRDWTGFTNSNAYFMARIGNIVSLLNNTVALNVANGSNTILKNLVSGVMP